MKVIFSNHFQREFENFDEILQIAVNAFVFHIQKQDMRGLIGRNKSSVDLTDTTKKGRERAKFAQKYCLWHYHLGVPNYTKQANGDLTSEMILHYMKYDDLIVLVDITSHPPFNLPELDKLTH